MGQFTYSKTHRTCPRCKHYGLIEVDFGWRKGSAGPIPRTYCRECTTVEKRLQQRARRASAREERLRLNPPPPEPLVGFKVCSQCDATLPLAAFHGPHLRRGAMRYAAACKSCSKVARDTRRAAMTEAEVEDQRRRDRESYYRNPHTRRRQHLKQFYNITPEQFEALKMRQQGLCAICKQPETRKVLGVVTELHIDHDHACCPERGRSCGNCIRGLLCSACNPGIGFLKDDPRLLLAAIDYLQGERPDI